MTIRTDTLRADTPALWRRWELPTWGVILVIYASWLALTWWHAALPAWLIIPVAAILLCWHGHLQHEVLHGHPTRITWLNELLVFPPLGMWFPYGLYRDTHLAHHMDFHLTCPIDDPESCYVTPRQWERMGAFRKAVLRFNNTVLGRLSIGPALATGALCGDAVRRLAQGDTTDLNSWVLHAIGCALVLTWLVGVVGFPLWLYLPCMYLGVSLIMMRSYAEHRPAVSVDHRICINEAEAPMALLFLNNNLHAVHHELPGTAWYELPRIYRENRDAWLEANGGFLWKGYRDIVRQFLFVPKDEPVHPNVHPNVEELAPEAQHT
ncbi:MAG: fatty acid desaturase [Rhodospirillales bacterium]|nr:fatty acid desaturase [Rhodospirillales bacterium]